MHEIATWLGLLAGAGTTLSFCPQVSLALRDPGHLAALSNTWLLGFGTGVLLWLIVGLMTGSVPLILANGLTFLLVGRIGVEKFRCGVGARHD